MQAAEAWRCALGAGFHRPCESMTRACGVHSKVKPGATAGRR